MTVWHLRGPVLPEGAVRDLYVAGGRITFEPLPDARTLARDVVLVPGLVDVHAHLSLHSPAGDAAAPEDRVRASARAHLDAGVLAVREPGSPDRASRGLGPAEALPRVTTAGRFLAPPGRYFPGLAREVPEGDLTRAALDELARSDGWVKLIGDFPVDGAVRPTFGGEALAEAVGEVHAAGGRVAIHCSLPEVVDAALAAGVDSLEHATFLAPDQVAALRDSGAVWVPTLTINPMIRSLLPPAAAPLLDRQPDVVRAAAEAGVTVLAGTDAGMGRTERSGTSWPSCTEPACRPSTPSVPARGTRGRSSGCLVSRRARLPTSRRTGRTRGRPWRCSATPRSLFATATSSNPPPHESTRMSRSCHRHQCPRARVRSRGG